MKLISSQKSPATIPAPSARVLVVDDSALSRGLLARALSSEFVVVQACDGAEAIELLRGSADFVCVVTDDQMPGATGIDVAEFVRATPALSAIPVVIVTAGSASPTQRQVEGHRAGAAVFINKPFRPTYVLSMVAMLVKSGHREAKTA